MEENDYRTLQIGETLQHGDEYMNGLGQWKPTGFAGSEVYSSTLYRRKITQETKSFAKSNHQNVYLGLPSAKDARKRVPICTGVLDYFPAAIAELAAVSLAGNDQHNPGQPLHWAREKSIDQADTITRHLIERGSRDSDGIRHSAKMAWRAMALLQTEIENEAGFKP